MKSGFVQLIVKNVLAGRQMKIIKPQQQRYTPSDSFRQYIYRILPKMQESIEIQILKKTLLKISNNTVRQELITAYIRRLFRLQIYQQDLIKDFRNIRPIHVGKPAVIEDPVTIKEMNEYSSYDQGRYALFTEDDMYKVFKNSCFGNFDKNQFGLTKKFGVMIRQQSITISYLLNIMNKIKEQKIQWSKIATMQENSLVQYLDVEENYVALYNYISNKIYLEAQKYRKNQQYMRIWGTSVISDVLSNSIIGNISNIQNLEEYVSQLVTFVHSLEKHPSANDFVKRFKQISVDPPLPIKSELPNCVKFFSKTPSLKSIFLGGQTGNGKSMILTYLTMWAAKNNWIVITVPDGRKWTFDTKMKTADIQRSYNGLFLIYPHAIQWLEQFIEANKQILINMPIKEEIYGKCHISGVRKDEYEPVPNLFDEGRQTYFRQIGDKVMPIEEHQIQQENKKSIIDILPQTPKNLLQLAQAGSINIKYIYCVIGEVLNQVYDSDHPILECVDGFSHFYRPSYYGSFRYFNDRGLYGKVPPYHLGICRFFMHLDGNKIKNGLKVVASSTSPLYRHKFDIKQIMLPQVYEHKVRNLTPQQFNNAGVYNFLTGWWQADSVLRQNLGYAYTITQGNWGDFQQLMKIGFYY